MSGAPRRKPRRLIVARGSLGDLFAGQPPLAAVSERGRIDLRARSLLALGAALGLHAAVGVAVLLHPAKGIPAAPRAAHREIAASIVHPPPPKPPPPRPPEHLAARAPRPMPRQPPPPPAQAGRAIAVEGPADLTSFDLVIGEGKSFAGGTSSARGTNPSAVHEAAQPGAKPRPASGPADLSRGCFPLRRDWSCDWPPEAQDSELREARATVRVRVTRDGDPARIEIIAAPPGGFAEAARSCAEREQYRVGFDQNGAPVECQTPLFNVRFVR